MNDFTKNMAQALFNQDKINDLLRKELQQAVNDLLEAELTAFLGYDPYARDGWNTGNSRNGAYFRKVDTQFGKIEIQVPRDRNGLFHQHTLPDYKQQAGIPAILGTVPTFARWIRSLAKLKSRCHETATACFISTRCLTTSSMQMCWKT